MKITWWLADGASPILIERCNRPRAAFHFNGAGALVRKIDATGYAGGSSMLRADLAVSSRFLRPLL